LSLFPFTIGGLTDSVNPCGLTIVVVFVMGLLAFGHLRPVLRKAGFFVAALFLTKFFMTAGLFEGFRSSSAFFFMGRMIYLLMGAVAIVLAGFHMRDWWVYKKTHSVEAFKIAWPAAIQSASQGVESPENIKAQSPWEKKRWSFLMFFGGIFMGFLGSVCPQPGYITTLLYAHIGRGRFLQAGFGLLVYSLGFVFPLLGAWALMMWMIRSQMCKSFLREHMAFCKIICSAALFAVGLGLIYTFF